MQLSNGPCLFRYAEGYDPDNWISVNKDTAEITLHTVPDRESPFVVNGTYYVKILCITDGKFNSHNSGTKLNSIDPKFTLQYFTLLFIIL